MLRGRSIDPTDRLSRLPPTVRLDFLRVLESDSRVRAYVIRQFHERGDEGMVDVLTDLEADKTIRGRIILILQEFEGAE